MNRVTHFELGAREPERAVEFYKTVFGWEITKWGGPEPNGGIMRHKDAQPRTVNTVAVDSVDDFAARVTTAGGQVVVEKMPIPGLGWQAYCVDTEGNLFGIHQHDPSAK